MAAAYFSASPYRVNEIASQSANPAPVCDRRDLFEYNVSRVVSFDVGIKHLSMCVCDVNFVSKELSIKRWIVTKLKGKNISDYTSEIIAKLKEEQFGCIDYILIEQQMNRNTQMKVLSHVIQAFFLSDLQIEQGRVHFVPPTIRFKLSSVAKEATNYMLIVDNAKETLGITSDKMTRVEYKKLSVEVARRLLTSSNMENMRLWTSNFMTALKKDDLADSYLQVMVWFLSRL